MDANSNRPLVSLEEYSKAISTLAKLKVDHRYDNEGNDHALVIFKNIFETASDNVNIVAKNLLNTEVANAQVYVDALRSYLQKDGVKLNLMLTHYDPNLVAEADLFKMIHETKAYREGRVKIYDLEGKSFKGDNKVVHFSFADGRMYRYETDIEKRKAFGNFNDPEKVNSLSHAFDKAIKDGMAKLVNLPF